MVFSKEDAVYIYDTATIKLDEQALIRLEDGLRSKKPQLITIDASHYGYLNGNGVVYRHDTVKNNITSFVRPSPKNIIEQHRPDTSEVFGKIIAADYKLTDYYSKIEEDWDVEGLDTQEYIEMCKDALLPLQNQDPFFNGLAFVQVVGKLNHEDAIKKVLNKEYLTVSIGAKPNKMICSECLQDQTKRLCSHYVNKRNGIFMLAEDLGYEELSFVKKPADPFGRIVTIHDGKMEERIFEKETEILEARVGIIDVYDFFNEINAGKEIVCVDNVCTIINDNQEENEMSKINVSLIQEFTKEVVGALTLKLNDSEETVSIESFELTDEDFKGMKHTQFAVVQKTPEGEKRRLPIHDEAHVRACLELLDKAEDLTDSELEKAKSKIAKAASKFGIEIEDSKAETEEEIAARTEEELLASTEEEVVTAIADDSEDSEKAEVSDIEKSIEELRVAISSFKEEVAASIKDEVLAEGKMDPVAKIFDLLKWFANDVAWAGNSLNAHVSSYLEDQGKKAIASGAYDELQTKVTDSETKVTELETSIKTLTDEKTEIQEEIELLDTQNIELNFQLRTQSVNELVSHKLRLGTIEDSETDIKSETDKLFKVTFATLQDQVTEYRKLAKKFDEEPVNNKKNQLETVDDPTLQDSVDENEETVTKTELKKVSDAEVRQALLSLKPNAFRHLFSNK